MLKKKRKKSTKNEAPFVVRGRVIKLHSRALSPALLAIEGGIVTLKTDSGKIIKGVAEGGLYLQAIDAHIIGAQIEIQAISLGSFVEIMEIKTCK